MTDDSTDEPTRPETVIATLPGCPEWCDQKHRNLAFDGGLTHEKWLGAVEVPGDIIGTEVTVAVSVTAHESINGLDVLRSAPEVQLVTGDFAWRMESAIAGLLGRYLMDADEHVMALEAAAGAGHDIDVIEVEGAGSAVGRGRAPRHHPGRGSPLGSDGTCWKSSSGPEPGENVIPPALK